jgi:hypothetical protein
MEWIAGYWKLILVFTLIHFTLGRSFSVLFAIFNQVPVFLYFPMALAYDYVQIPVYGAILEHSSRSFFPVGWLKRKADHVLARMDERPIRGFGILSGSIVSFFLKKGRVEGTVLLMTGSFIGIFIIMGIANGMFKIISLF